MPSPSIFAHDAQSISHTLQKEDSLFCPLFLSFSLKIFLVSEKFVILTKNMG